MGISLSDMFFAAAEETLSYEQILEDVQKYCTDKHADKLSTEGNQEEARRLLKEIIYSISTTALIPWMAYPQKSYVTPFMRIWPASPF